MSELEYFQQVKKKLDQVSSSFCLAKWQQVTLHLHNGNTQSCHHVQSHRVDSEKLAHPAALHNTPEKQFARQQMLKGERPPECEYCWKIEDQGALSDRISKSGAPWAYPLFEQVLKEGIGTETIPSYVELAFDSACQFKCMYCSPAYSTKWQKEIEEFGAYPTAAKLNSLEALNQMGVMPRSESEKAKYIEAFWRWWPELAPKLRELRVTGGEPFLSPETFRLIDSLVSYPQPHLIFSINTNMGFNAQQLNSFLDRVESLRKSVKKIVLFTSLDTVGAQAEYIRFGLNYRAFNENIDRVLSKVKGPIRVTFMITVNNLCLPGLKNLMMLVRDLRMKYPQHEIGIDTPYLRDPAHMSVELLPPSFVSYIDEAIEYMKDMSGLKVEAPFSDLEILRVSRIRLLMLQSSLTVSKKRVLGVDFYRMFCEYDRRRGTQFLTTFPEYQNFWKDCQWLDRRWNEVQRGRLTFQCMEPAHLERLAELLPDLYRLRIGFVSIPFASLGLASKVIEGLREQEITVASEIPLSVFSGESQENIIKQLGPIRKVSLHIDLPIEGWPDSLNREPQQFEVLRVLIALEGRWLEIATWRDFFKKTPDWIQNKIEILVKSSFEDEKRRPTAHQVYDLLRIVRKEFPQVYIKSLRQDEDAELLLGEVNAFPNLKPVIEKKTTSKAPALSVIIPTYNQAHFLVRQLAHLTRQTFPRDQFEVIVVDDGSQDRTEEVVRSFIASCPGDFQISFYQNPRPQIWTNPLPLHRAGVARNIGAEVALGERFLFLDSDILFDREFLRNMWEASEKYEVIQCPRLHVMPADSRDLFNVDENRPKRTYVEESGYWGPFFSTKNWSRMSFFWKYTCTYCLCVDRKLFWKVGAFDRSLLTYGFEDTQFGYQAFREGARFHLLKHPVYHLTDDLHEFRFGLFSTKRRRLLAQSAQHFYFNHLDSDIFMHFWNFMRKSDFIQKIFSRYFSRIVSASK